MFTKNESRRIIPPLGIGYLASALKDRYEVKLLDTIIENPYNDQQMSNDIFRYGMSDAEIKREIQKFQPDIVGISSLFSSESNLAHQIAGLAKEVDRDIITVIGGGYPTLCTDECMKDKNIDFAVFGEADHSFPCLMRQIQGNQDYHTVSGIAYRDKSDCDYKTTPQKGVISDLDSLPFPARDLMGIDKYYEVDKPQLPYGSKVRSTPYTNLITSRGCPAKCIFCSNNILWGYKFRKRSVENIMREIDLLINDYKIQEIHFQDDNLTFDRNRAKALCRELIARNYKITWAAPNGIALFSLDKELIHLMRESGCWQVGLGIESGNQDVLFNIIKKPLNLKKTLPLIETMKEVGIETYGFFMMGFPGETRKQIQDTVDLALRLNLDYNSFSIATPYPGTQLYEIAKKQNLLQDWNINNLKFSRGNIQTDFFKPEELEEIRSSTWNLLRKRKQMACSETAV